MMNGMTLTPEMLDSFLAESWDAVALLERSGWILRGQDARKPEDLAIISHRLRGSAGLYGFPEISRLASLLERIFESATFFSQAQIQLASDFSHLAMACLTEGLERITKHGHEGEIGQDLSRFGAPAIMTELVKLNPSAFARVSNPNSSVDGPAALSATNPAQAQRMVVVTKPKPVVSLEAELRAFHNQDSEMWSYFAPEVQEHLEAVGSTIEMLLMGSVTGEQPTEHIQALFRVWHTIKGAAYSVGCQPIGKLAHKLEDALVSVREGQQNWSPQLASAVIQGADAVSLMLSAAEGKTTRLLAAVEQFQSSLSSVLGQNTDLGLLANTNTNANVEVHTEPTEATHGHVIVNSETQTTPVQTNKQAKQNNETIPAGKTGVSLRVPLAKLENLMDLSGETVISRGKFERLVRRYEDLATELQETMQRFTRSAQDFTERYLNPRLSNLDLSEANNDAGVGPTIGKGRSASEMFSELEFDRYDDLNILARSVGEMASDLDELHDQFSDATQGFARETETLGKLTRNFRNDVSQLRLVPMANLFTRVRRQARQLSSQKAFGLELKGEDVQVDNIVLEGLTDPLIHLLTNAVAHGFEEPNVRKERGKPVEGLVRIRAYQRGNFVYLEVQDDGQGIEVGRVRQQAIERGLRSRAEVEKLSDEAALELVFLPGLSTKETVTEQAGRGVGMDAVFTALRRMKGEVSLSSEPGYGTRITLRVPLTLVVSDVLLLKAGQQTFAIPRDAVRALRAVSSDAITNFQGQPHVLLGAELLPLLDLEHILHLPHSEAGKLTHVAVLEVGNEKIALRVHDFAGLEQTVVKPLEEPLSRLDHFSGASVNSDGEVILVLDPTGLNRLEMAVENEAFKPLKRGTPASPVVAQTALQILLVDDSLSVRRVVSQTLKRGGYAVTTAADGQEALDLLGDRSFDVVITDLEMPRLNGFELIEEIRRRRHLASIPVAMLTSRASDKHAQLALELGVNEYLTKPLDDAKLEKFLGGVKNGLAQKVTVKA